MPRLAGKANVDRILVYLDQEICNATTLADREQLSAAWVLVFKSYYRPKETAFARVLEAYGIQGSSKALMLFGIGEQTEVDGRKGREWMASVLRYLEYRRDIAAINFTNCHVPKYFPAAPPLSGCVWAGQDHIRDYMKITRRERRRKPKMVPKKAPQKVALAKTAVA